jgi:hypothetical protein
MIKIHKVPNKFDSDRGFEISQILDLFDFEFVSDLELRISDFDWRPLHEKWL